MWSAEYSGSLKQSSAFLNHLIADVVDNPPFARPVNPAFLETIQTFVLSPSCPRPVILLCKDQLYDLLSLKRLKNITTFDVTAIRNKLNEVTKRNASGMCP